MLILLNFDNRGITNSFIIANQSTSCNNSLILHEPSVVVVAAVVVVGVVVSVVGFVVSVVCVVVSVVGVVVVDAVVDTWSLCREQIIK